MLHLEFGRPVSEAAGATLAAISPANVFRLSRNQLCTEYGDKILATYRAGGWMAQSLPFTGFQCRGTTLIHFESASGELSRQCGPFDGVSMEEGTVRVAHGQLFAAYQEQNRLWHSFVLGSDWPVIILTAAVHAARGGGSATDLSFRSSR
jgi:hypothetical protein